jgi:NAD(P)-dependent dehydrogenase (short-subunit alcohol dehydrogenase family)
MNIYYITGLGFAFARRLDEDGLVVFAGCLNGKGEGARKLKSDCSKKLHVVEIDVSQEKSVESALTYVRNNLPRHGKFTECLLLEKVHYYRYVLG